MEKKLSIIKAKVISSGINQCGNYESEDYELDDFRQDTIDVIEEFFEEDTEQEIKDKKRIIKYIETQEDLQKLAKYVIKLDIWTTPYLKSHFHFVVDGVEYDYKFKPTKKYKAPQQSKYFVSRLI